MEHARCYACNMQTTNTTSELQQPQPSAHSHATRMYSSRTNAVHGTSLQLLWAMRPAILVHDRCIIQHAACRKQHEHPESQSAMYNLQQAACSTGARQQRTPTTRCIMIAYQRGQPNSQQVEEFRKHCLVHGLDDIGLTMQVGASAVSQRCSIPHKLVRYGVLFSVLSALCGNGILLSA